MQHHGGAKEKQRAEQVLNLIPAEILYSNSKAYFGGVGIKILSFIHSHQNTRNSFFFFYMT